MSNPTPRVRFLINAFLKVERVDGTSEEVSIPSNSYHTIQKIKKHPDGYADIVLENGDVITGLKLEDVLELHGDVVVEEVKPVVAVEPPAKKNRVFLNGSIAISPLPEQNK